MVPGKHIRCVDYVLLLIYTAPASAADLHRQTTAAGRMGAPAEDQVCLTHFFMQQIAPAGPDRTRHRAPELSDEAIYALHQDQLAVVPVMLAMRQKYLSNPDLVDATSMALFIEGLRLVDLRHTMQSWVMQPDAGRGSMITVLLASFRLGLELRVIAKPYIIYLHGTGARRTRGDPTV